ncbi:branched-chain amino acid ABC transporter permease [Halopenitus persicus]|uniref:Branched-chain amino acid transport system / permease component n=1 Tax=Halopenitus persicus TaxID=1048396 RepID=A0A1H3E4N1_9EURY|nr:branched-chain amino acid ABC transporter permease [Halopenitus persicus]QHS16493.1 branched-chain amino acid ABC transporter permease [haloarchaeon 3A1-DGR]SDX73635.1 Branched-chain amino acid transport system / permease component [Halopenitus persicus]
MAVSDVVVSFALLVAIYGVLSLGLNVKFGHTGLLDFGHVGFFLVGAYTSALFVLPPDDPADFTNYVIGFGEIPLVGTWAFGIIVATILTGVIGGLVALPTIRLREDYLAITLLGISVIFQRVVQSESWLANGPDALRGYSPPFQGLFPIEPGTLVGAVAFSVVVFVVWAVATAALSLQRENDSRLPLDRIYAVTTFGLGTRAAGVLGSRFAVAGVAGLIAAVISAALLLAASLVLLVGALVSVYGWLVVLVAIGQHYADLDRRELALGVGFGTGLLVALLPLPIADRISVSIVGTLALLGALVYAYYHAITSYEWVADVKLTVVGLGAVWFVGIWYVLLPILGPLGSGSLSGVLGTLFRNVVWFLQFGSSAGIGYSIAVIGDVTVQLDYSRFQLALFLLSLGALYTVLEAAVQSPFGRVLRAIRNDEAVVKSLGKDPFVYKVQSMVIGSALGGFAGAMWAMYSQGLTFRTGAPETTFIALLIVFVGGVGNNKGVLLGAVLYWGFQQATTQLAGFFPPALRVNVLAFRLVVVGVLFLIVLYYMPDGLLGREEYSSGVGDS